MGKRTNTATWSEKYSRWQINVQKDGYRRSFYSSTPGRTGQREANAKADAWLDSGIIGAASNVEKLFTEFAEANKLLSGSSAAAQIDYYKRVWIVPNIGRVKIANICDNDIQKLLDQMVAKGLSRKSVQNCKGILSKFFKWCRKNKYTDYRPDDVEISASARNKGKRVLQPDELATLFSSTETTFNGKPVEDPYIYSYRFAVLTGLRPGELRGLKWEDITGNVVNVRRAINIHGEETRGKNENAVRSFVLSDQAAQALQRQREQGNRGEYVFPLPPHSAYYNGWKTYCKHNGITPVSLYELRHTFVSIAKTLSEGEIKPLVGHSKNMDTFSVYGHELSGEDAATAQKVTAIFDRLTSRPASVETESGDLMQRLKDKLHSITDEQNAAEILALVDALIKEKSAEKTDAK
ncbi:MAG: site-specific integrase [Firmicutes bacterium]|nr:site-specific integrase [Bacillota bacterium]MDY4107615.1 site-specific integrase [Oscillospiraceae bacterium]